MKIFSGISGLIILALILCFALSNQANVTVGLWPMAATMQMPLYLVALGPLVFGLLFGAGWGWLSGWPHRLKARRLHKEIHMLNDKIDDLQHVSIDQQEPMPLKRTFWGRKP